MHFHTFCFICCVLLNSEISARTSNSLRITLPNGSKLLGRHLTSSEGRRIRGFIGIPYAEPPIGELRFRSPIPKKSWPDERRVTEDVAICTQIDRITKDFNVIGSEDCLYLNVYTPQIHNPDKLLDVMVYFHGGGLESGSSSSKLYGPDFLLNHNILLVVGNYRLGVLGFLSTEQEDCPGNFGLKDQALILRWINENIQVFGGNPNSVTVFGESAGAASVTYIMKSPLTAGLFHRAIAQSGTNVNSVEQRVAKGVIAKRAEKVGALVGCENVNGNSWKEMIDCMRQVSPINLTKSVIELIKWSVDPLIIFPPVVESEWPGAYITKSQTNLTDSYGLNVPFITGINTDEGLIRTASFFLGPELDDIKNQPYKVLPIALNYDHHSDVVQNEVTDNILKFYFNNEKLEEKHYQNLTNLFTDVMFLSGLDTYLKLRLSHREANDTFVYLFAHNGYASFTEIFNPFEENSQGVCHADDILYLFPLEKEAFITSVPSKFDLQIRQLMVKMWVNFARTGNPTPCGTNLIKWKPVNGFPIDMLRIGNKHFKNKPSIGMERNLFENRIEFWRKLNVFLPADERIYESNV